MHIREAVETYLKKVLSIERLAFGCDKMDGSSASTRRVGYRRWTR